VFITFKNKLLKFLIIIRSFSVFGIELIASVDLVSYDDFHLERGRLFLENLDVEKNLSSEDSFLKASAELYLLKNFRNFNRNDYIIMEIYSKTLGKYYTNKFTIGFSDTKMSFQQFFIFIKTQKKDYFLYSKKMETTIEKSPEKSHFFVFISMQKN